MVVAEFWVVSIIYANNEFSFLHFCSSNLGVVVKYVYLFCSNLYIVIFILHLGFVLLFVEFRVVIFTLL